MEELARKSVIKSADIINENLINQTSIGVYNNLNICCNNEEYKLLIDKVMLLQKNYPCVKIEAISFAIVILYYSLNLCEQNEEHLYISVKELSCYSEYLDLTDIHNVIDIYMCIATRDSELASNIRRSFLFNEETPIQLENK